MEPWEAAAQAPKAALEPWEAAAQQPGIGTRLLGDLQNRIAAGNEIANDPNRSALVKVPQYVGKVGAGLANDAIGEVIKSGVAAIPQGVKDAASTALAAGNDAAAAASPYIPGLRTYTKLSNDAADSTVKAYKGASPETRDSIDAAANVVGLGANLAAGVGAAGKVADVAGAARKGINALSDAAGSSGPIDFAKFTKGPLPTSKGLFSEGDKAFADAESSGTGAKPVATNKFLDQAISTAQQDPNLLSIHGPDAAQNYLERLQAMRDKPMPLSTAQALNIDLRESASKAFRAGDNNLGIRFKAMRAALRSNIYDADPTMLTGGPNGFSALQQGNRLYSAGYKAEEIENALETGLKHEVPATGIKTQFKNIAKDIQKNGPQGWTPEQVADINAAARTGALTGFLKNMGSKFVAPTAGALVGGAVGAMGGPVAAGAAAALGSAAGYVAGAPFRAAATALQEAKGAKVLRGITGETTYKPYVTPPEPVKPMLALPAPDAQYAVGADGVARRLTAEEAQASAAARQNLDNMGLTGDVRSNINRIEQKSKEEVWYRGSPDSTELNNNNVFWFSKNPEAASMYAMQHPNFYPSDPRPSVMRATIAPMNNPATGTMYNNLIRKYSGDQSAVIKELKKSGYDGVIMDKDTPNEVRLVFGKENYSPALGTALLNALKKGKK